MVTEARLYFPSTKREILKRFHDIVGSRSDTIEGKNNKVRALIGDMVTRFPYMRQFFENRTLSVGGIRHILQKEVHHFPTYKNIKVCAFIEDFWEEARARGNQINSLESFIVRVRSKNSKYLSEHNHFTHIILETKDGTTRFFITDSQAKGLQYTWIPMLIIRFFPGAGVYSLHVVRQVDTFTSSIFSLRDALACMKDRTILSTLSNSRYALARPESPSSRFSLLPHPIMMEGAQCLEIVNTYLPIAQKEYLSGDIAALQRKITKNQMTPGLSRLRAINGTIILFFYDYVKQIIQDTPPEQFFETLPPSTKSISQRSYVILRAVEVLGKVAMVAGVFLLGLAFLRYKGVR